MKVLLVDDSRTVRAYVEGILRDVSDITLLPAVTDGASAVQVACSLKPDLILMDLMLPALDGIAAIRQIMALSPCPIVVLSETLNSAGRDRTFEAFSEGAVDVLAKPQGLLPGHAAEFASRLLATVRLMAQARVIRRMPRSDAPKHEPGRAYDVVAIGASVGGPQVLQQMLKQLPAPYPLPVVITQHILPGYEATLAAWLSSTTGHNMRVAATGDLLRPQVIHLAPSLHHLAVRGLRCELLAPGKTPVVPSVDAMFESVAASYHERAVGVLLTGMGEDGTRGLLTLRQHGALTITQRAETCVVDGMPAAARALHASQLELSPLEIVELLRSLP